MLCWGRIGRNWDNSLQSFPPCYAQSLLLMDFNPHPRAKVGWNLFVIETIFTETSNLRTLKIMPRNLYKIGRSWLRLLYRFKSAQSAVLKLQAAITGALSLYSWALAVQLCPVLSCPVLSCPVLSCPVQSSPVQSSSVKSSPVQSCPVSSCCPVKTCPVQTCHVLAFPVLFWSGLSSLHLRSVIMSFRYCSLPCHLITDQDAQLLTVTSPLELPQDHRRLHSNHHHAERVLDKRQPPPPPTQSVDHRQTWKGSKTHRMIHRLKNVIMYTVFQKRMILCFFMKP